MHIYKEYLFPKPLEERDSSELGTCQVTYGTRIRQHVLALADTAPALLIRPYKAPHGKRCSDTAEAAATPPRAFRQLLATLL